MRVIKIFVKSVNYEANVLPQPDQQRLRIHGSFKNFNSIAFRIHYETSNGHLARLATGINVESW